MIMTISQSAGDGGVAGHASPPFSSRKSEALIELAGFVMVVIDARRSEGVEMRPRIELDGEFLTSSDEVDCGLVVVPEWTGQEAEACAVMDGDVIVARFRVGLRFMRERSFLALLRRRFGGFLFAPIVSECPQ